LAAAQDPGERRVPFGIISDECGRELYACVPAGSLDQAVKQSAAFESAVSVV